MSGVQESGENSVDSLDSGFSSMATGSRGDNAGQASGAAGADCYKMNHPRRGKFIIVNNKTFEPSTGMTDRSGTDQDASNLSKSFQNLGFEVIRYDNQTAYQMLKIMMKAGEENYHDCDCFAMAVLSHGEHGILYGIDDTITVENLVEPIKKCLSLAGKPKLFFFQSCRGSELDEGVEVQSDADAVEPRKTARIPEGADFLFAYSTTPGHFSWRNSNKGSWFIQALCRVLSDPAYRHLDLMRMLTRVNRIVAYEFESNASQAHMTRKKQASSMVHQLTRDLYFYRK